jgi:hypothetical protein
MADADFGSEGAAELFNVSCSSAVRVRVRELKMISCSDG